MSFETIRRVSYASAPSCLTAANLARDFDRYHLPLNRLQSRLLHGPGVLDGLEPSASPDRTGVVVSPGVALDARGRTIVLSDDGIGLVGTPPQPANAPVLVPIPPGTVGPLTLTLTVEYSEDATVPIDAANPAGCKQVEFRPRFRMLAPGTPPGADAVVLGVVDVGADGKVTGLAPASRARPGVKTSGLTVERIGPGDFAKTAVADLAPAADGGAHLGVPSGPLTIDAATTEIRGTEPGAVALYVSGSLAVSDKIILGEPGFGLPLDALLTGLRATIEELQGVVEALKGETAELRRALAAPVATTVWASAVTATAQNFGRGSSSVGVGMIVANVFPLERVTFKLAVPAPAQVAGRPVTLRRIFVIGATGSPFLGTVSLFDGMQPIQAPTSRPLAGDFSSPTPAGTFDLDSPRAMTAGLLVQLDCMNLLPNLGHAIPTDVPSPFFFISIGAEFIG